MNKISGLIITFNESRNIVAAIRSLRQVCDDIVVVDSLSSDNTVELARAEGAFVISQAFLGDGPQRIVGVPHCQHDWILNLDADERLEDDLVDWLNANDLESLPVDAIETRRRNFVGLRTTRFAGQYPDYICRIFDRRNAHFLEVFAHTRIQAKRLLRISAHITHYSFADYPDILMRACKYGMWLGKQMADKNREVWPLTPYLHGLFSFIKHYVIKLGFLAGADGFAISLGKGLGSYVKYAHARYLRRQMTR